MVQKDKLDVSYSMIEWHNTAQSLKQPPQPRVPENEIRDRAYYIWMSKGCPIDSTAMDDWLEAERIARGED